MTLLHIFECQTDTHPPPHQPPLLGDGLQMLKTTSMKRIKCFRLINTIEVATPQFVFS